jgi:hypothetical protein
LAPRSTVTFKSVYLAWSAKSFYAFNFLTHVKVIVHYVRSSIWPSVL